MTLDDATGLPALPEGYFWRVRHRRFYPFAGYDFMRTDTTRLQVLLVKAWTEISYTSYPKPWYRFKSTSVRNEYDRENTLFVEDAEGTHPIAVRNATHRIMKQWEKAKVRDALIGDYPPKKLGEL